MKLGILTLRLAAVSFTLLALGCAKQGRKAGDAIPLIEAPGISEAERRDLRKQVLIYVDNDVMDASSASISKNLEELIAILSGPPAKAEPMPMATQMTGAAALPMQDSDGDEEGEGEAEKEPTSKPMVATSRLSPADAEEFGKLPEGDRAFLASIAKFLKVELIATTANSESSHLQENICQSNPRYEAGFALLKNTALEQPLTDRHSFLPLNYCMPGTEKVEGATLALSKETRKAALAEPFASQPVASMAVMQEAFKEIFRIYPARDYRYIVVVKSSSFDDVLIASRLPYSLKEVAPPALWQALIKERPKMVDAKNQLTASRDVLALIYSVVRTVSGNGTKPFPGVSTKDFLQTLGAYSEAEIPLVVLDANLSDARVKEAQALKPGNVTEIVTLKNSDQFGAIDYKDFFKAVFATATSLLERYQQILAPIKDFP